MTGTSIDGLDIALLKISGQGLALDWQLQSCGSFSLAACQQPLKRLAQQQPMSAKDICQLNQAFSRVHVSSIDQLLAGRQADLIAIHGQTLCHQPPLSWQLINAPLIAHRLATPVVFDLRAADLAAGGEGAPLSPLADALLYSTAANKGYIINLGGFANYSLLPERQAGHPLTANHLAQIAGGDICVCNQLLDKLADVLLNKSYDDNGQVALQGALNPELFQHLFALLKQQASAGRSLGSGDELPDWLQQQQTSYSPATLLRSTCAAIAQVIVDSCDQPKDILLAGGGVNNRCLVEEIKQRTQASVQTSDDLGVPSQYREAMMMAILGTLCADQVAITLPQVTGCNNPAPLSGCWVYG
jgi:1,6-anhydro-N-acetylmuramate kinase